MSYKHGRFETDGNDLQKQMQNAQQPGCKFPRSTVDLDDLNKDEWTINYTYEPLPHGLACWTGRLGLKASIPVPEGHEGPYRYVCLIKRELPPISWVGRVGEGVIVLDIINRVDGNTYYISDLTKLAYQEFFDLDTLRYVFATCVVNGETTYLLNEIYNAHDIVPFCSAEYTWEASTAEFRALIGCGIGKCVSTFILAAYGQGVKQITKIITWRVDAELEMLFYIENVA
ncbi:hypothetical protein N7466_009357 [Penicillium verhagenii]|uniref:uncharacterized protein n=1 Tax=Penicillium verhagenii TaxID=1562060 RepID=UPI002545059B|nr:uncharacterized protein N7466_009357 [Penicillium verhagenii]KAJ5921031.1 hypothetical protein N7466_009357 [Penicillium verhagenii]